MIRRTMGLLCALAAILPLSAADSAAENPAESIEATAFTQPYRLLELASDTGGVIVVENVTNAASGTCRVKLSLPNPGRKIAAGSKGTIRFVPAPGSPE